MLRFLRELFRARASGESTLDGHRILARFEQGEMRQLSDGELSLLVQSLISQQSGKHPLAGNQRFLHSVNKDYSTRGRFTIRQRYAIYNILDRAYAGNGRKRRAKRS